MEGTGDAIPPNATLIFEIEVVSASTVRGIRTMGGHIAPFRDGRHPRPRQRRAADAGTGRGLRPRRRGEVWPAGQARRHRPRHARFPGRCWSRRSRRASRRWASMSCCSASCRRRRSPSSRGTCSGCAGIVISASHNPYEDNGLKIFNAQGLKCDDALELETGGAHPRRRAARQGRDRRRRSAASTRWPDAAARYARPGREGLRRRTLDLRGVKIVVDAGNGAAYETTPRGPARARRGGARAQRRAERHEHQRRLRQHASRGDAAGRASRSARRSASPHDGDADRLICCDETGSLLDGDEMLAVIGLRSAEARASWRRIRSSRR